jgi:hypothetical protein
MRWRELGQCHTRFQDDGRERNFCQRHVFYGCSFRVRGKVEVVDSNVFVRGTHMDIRRVGVVGANWNRNGQ